MSIAISQKRAFGRQSRNQTVRSPTVQIRRSRWRVQAQDDLKVTKRDLGDSRVEFTLEVSSETTQRCYDQHVEYLRNHLQVPGFRKGAEVPVRLLSTFRGGEEKFKGEVLQKLIVTSVERAMKDWQGVAIEDSDRIESDVQELIENFTTEEPMTFSISFDVISEVKWKLPFREIKVDVEENGTEEGDAQKVEKMCRMIRKERGMQRIVADRGLELGDVAILDFDFVRPDNRESFPQLKQEKFRFDTDLPDALGVVKHLKGIEVGEVREFDIKFPEDWEPPIFQGLDTLVIVKCHELFSWDLPELSDEMVQSLNRPAWQTVQEFKSSMLLAESQRRVEKMKELVQAALRQELAKAVDMAVSESAIMETAKFKYQTMLLEYQAKGKVDQATIQELATPEMLSNYMMTHRTELETIQKGLAAMEAVYKALGLSVSEEELTAEVTEAEQEFKEKGEEYDRERLEEMARELLQNAKVVEWFVKNGNIKILPYKQVTAFADS